MKGKDEQAQRAISRILSAPLESPEVNEEFAEIAANLHHERAIGATSYLDCFRNGPGRNGLRMWTGLGIQSLQQFAGIVSPPRFGRFLRLLDANSPLTHSNSLHSSKRTSSSTVRPIGAARPSRTLES